VHFSYGYYPDHRGIQALSASNNVKNEEGETAAIREKYTFKNAAFVKNAIPKVLCDQSTHAPAVCSC